MSRPGKVLALLRIKPHAPPLCGPRQFICPLTLRLPPGGRLIALAAPLRSLRSQRLVDIVYGVDYQVSLNCLLPTLSHLSVSISPGGRLRHWCSFLYLRISPLHRKFHHSLPYSSSVVLKTVSQVEPGDFTSNLLNHLRALYAQ